MSFNVNVDGRTTNDINFVYTTSNISVDNISSDNFSATNASIVNLSATTLQLQNLDLVRENVCNISVSNISIGNGTATFLSSSVLIANSNITSSIKNLSSNTINASNINVCNIIVPTTATINNLNTNILNVNTSLNISNFNKFKDDNGSTIIDKLDLKQNNICVGANLELTHDEIIIKTTPEFINMCIKYDLNMVAISSQINSCGKINVSNLCVSNGSFGNLTAPFINTSILTIPSQSLTSSIYNLSTHKINTSILNINTSLNISNFDKFKDDNGSTIIDKINTRQANICVGGNLQFLEDQITIRPHPEFTNLSIRHDLTMVAISSEINSCGKMNISNLCVSNGSFGNLTAPFINTSLLSIPSQILTSSIYNLSSNKINVSILNVNTSLNISNFDRFKDDNGSTIIDKINTRQANICVGGNLQFLQDQITIKPHPEFTNLSIKYDLTLLSTSSRFNSSNISTNYISVSNRLQATNISCTSLSVSVKLNAHNMSVKHISNLGAGSYLRSKNISATNLSVNVLHISSPLVLTNNILASNAIINLSSTDQLQLGASTLTQILDNIEIDTSNLSVGILNISENLNLSVLNSSINMVSGTTINLSNSSQMIINGSTLHQLLNETSGTNLLVNSLSLIGTNTCINITPNGKLNVCNFSQIVDVNGSKLTDKLDDKQDTLSTTSGELLINNNLLTVTSIAQNKVTGLSNSLGNKQNTLSTTSGELLINNNLLTVTSIAQNKVSGLSNSFDDKQDKITVTDEFSFGLNQLGMNSIGQSKVGGLTAALGNKQNTLSTTSGELLINNNLLTVTSIPHTKIGFANNGTISFPSAFQLNFTAQNGEINMANGRIKNGTGGIVSLDINRGASYDGYINMHDNTCLNMCGNSNIRVTDFNQILKGTTNLQSTLNTYTPTSTFNDTVATLATTSAVNTLLTGFVTTTDFTNALNTKQSNIVGTDNIETYILTVAGIDINNIRLKTEINITKINAAQVNFSDNIITFDMIDNLPEAFHNKQNVLTLGDNLEFDVNTCNLQLKNEIHLTKINSSDVNFSDDSIEQIMVNGLTASLSGKQNVLSLGTNLEFDTNTSLRVKDEIHLTKINSSDVNFSDDSIEQSMVNGLTPALSGKQPTLTLADNLQFDGNNELDLHNNISVDNISLDIDGTITDLGTYLTTTSAPLTGFFNISVHNGSIDTKRDMNLSSLNVSSLNARDLQIILNGSFGMRNTQLPARKGELEITTASFNISTSSNLPIAFKITNTERMKLTPTELTLDCNLSQGQNYSANISNLTSNVMIGNSVNTSTLNASLINVSDLVLQVIDTTTINTRYLNSSFCNICEGNFSDINGSDGNISECVIRTLTGLNATYTNLNSTLFNTCDITCDDFTLEENGIMKLETSTGSIRGELTANSTKFSIGASSGQYTTLTNANTEIVNIYDNKVDMNVSLNISGKVNSSNFTVKNNNNELSIDANTNEFNIYSNGLPIHFNVNTNPFTTNNMEMTQTKNLMLKDLEMGNAVSANISTLNASTISVSTFNITQTSFTNLNASNINISSPGFVALDMTREINSPGGGCMIQLQKSHATGATPDPAWRFGPSGSSTILNNFTLEPDYVTGGDRFNYNIDGTLLLTTNYTSRMRFTTFGNSPNTNVAQLDLHNSAGNGFTTQITPGSNSELKWRKGNYPFGSGGGSLMAMIRNNGQLSAHSYANFSDDRLKHNEANIQGLEILRQLNPQRYIKTQQPIRDNSGNMLHDYINQDISGIEEAGFIAQEILQTDISYCVSQMTGEEFNAYTLDYNSIFTYAVQAIKELDVLLQKQTNQYNELDISVQELKTKVNDLEAENDILKGLIQ